MFSWRKIPPVAAAVMLLAQPAFSRQSDSPSHLVAVTRWQYHPNRLGAEAHLQGGAMAAAAGNPAAMVINPASLASMPDRLSLFVEAGWASRTDFFRFLNINIASQFQPAQYAGVAWRPLPQLALGVSYHRPTNYDLDLGEIQLRSAFQPAGTNAAGTTKLRRQEHALGVALATSVNERFHFGGSVQWRRASMTDEIPQAWAEGSDSAWRFAVGALWQYRDWQFGLAAQSHYQATNALTMRSPAQITERFLHEEPATLRLGLTLPPLLQRLRLSADVEFKDFKANLPIEKWQFYGGGTLSLSPQVEVGCGAFTFLKDYSAFVDGPESEIFLTGGARVQFGRFRLTASFLDGDLLNRNFAGQRGVNLALGYAMP